jgi:hypothetical protein
MAPACPTRDRLYRFTAAQIRPGTRFLSGIYSITGNRSDT